MLISELVENLTGQPPPAALLTAWEEVLSEADQCLATYTQTQIDLAKAYAVAHFMTQQSGGQVKSDKSPTGASVTFNEWKGQGVGLESTVFGTQLLSLPGGRCIAAVIDKPEMFAVSVGGS